MDPLLLRVETKLKTLVQTSMRLMQLSKSRNAMMTIWNDSRTYKSFRKACWSKRKIKMQVKLH